MLGQRLLLAAAPTMGRARWAIHHNVRPEQATNRRRPCALADVYLVGVAADTPEVGAVQAAGRVVVPRASA
nr:hypothetical protein GCM10020063_009830 [Dactylosporangium thailandense]